MTISPAATASAQAPATITDVPHPPPPRPAGPGPRTALGTALGAGLASWPGRRRVWALYAAFALYAGAVAVFSGPGDDRSWGIWAAFGYAAAAALAARWPGRAGRRAALAAGLAGALAAPVVWLATQASPTPDVRVVSWSAVLLLHHGTPYLGPAQLAQGNVLSYNPYLPVMTIFGLPHALGLPGLAGTSAAARRIALGLALMFALSPVTRFGYFAYPIALLAWPGLCRDGRTDQPDPAARLNAASVAGMPAWASRERAAPPGAAGRSAFAAR